MSTTFNTIATLLNKQIYRNVSSGMFWCDNDCKLLISQGDWLFLSPEIIRYNQALLIWWLFIKYTKLAENVQLFNQLQSVKLR